ncbi:unnamed protein product [Spodoptera littoralis]|uniref:Uncharacterized protein n=1 Tax=Spodoptera littoralis TaxID=7109 RepID=A0A9P0I0B5_SPOLI|nr:unnamed protein product [Spodoptera littoralis]CAH1637073.1 unnamed protein product [Spodoptera littoralis]
MGKAKNFYIHSLFKLSKPSRRFKALGLVHKTAMRRRIAVLCTSLYLYKFILVLLRSQCRTTLTLFF